MKRRAISLMVVPALLSVLTACGATDSKTAGTTAAPAASVTPAAAEDANKTMTLDQITEKAKQEGKVVSVGMPDTWANWKDTWNELSTKHGIQHTDTDMSSVEEIAKFEAEKDKPTADIGDVGMAFTSVAVEKGVVQPYKPSTWDKIPEWAKDKDGNWVVGYQGTIAIMTNTKLVKNPPKSFDDILKGDYKVAIGDVAKASQAQTAILAAAMAFGGDEKNIQPGIDFFEKLSKQKRISLSEVKVANFEKGEVEVALVWDFNALGYKDQLKSNDYDIVIPKEASVIGGYATIINKYAPHPNAAKLTREYILSDAGQINLAKGFARPIRDDVKLPDDVASKMIPIDQYKNARPIKDFKAWDAASKAIPQMWEEKVLVNLN
ncbi:MULTISPECIES: ABC transporter substrate-binding protein [Paenibacillus]|uniref:ABC transporter substrate-binding protein n=1 Tax=Paenibacillus TaxID=44249 RepID=UPI0022B8EAD1|nr:ABC transporter substrate-binding protein [Paenibacillus caseinilyticus]MCZ8521331.1 ABC transporter substrate-binding protein [Paenibacillus caseinilyticus]